jgi:hypothetical protein
MGIGNYRGAEIPYGSVSGRNKGLEKNPSDVKAGIQQVMRQEIGPAYDKESMDAPCLRNRARIYWTGGAAWATATFMHPGKSLSPVVTISRHDIETFLVRLNDGSWDQKPLQYSFPQDTKLATQTAIRDAAEKDKKKVMDTFAREDLLAGVSIMKTVLDFSNPSAVVTFVRTGGNFLVGYALEKHPEDHAGTTSQQGQ